MVIYKVMYTEHCKTTLRIEAIECINNESLGHIHQSQSSDSLLIHSIASILKVVLQCFVYMSLLITTTVFIAALPIIT